MKKSLIILFFIVGASISAQNGYSVAAHINSSIRPTEHYSMDLVARFELQDVQGTYGYFVAYPEFQHIALETSSVQRYSLNMGYIMNSLFIDRFEIGAYIGYGFTANQLAYFSFSGTGDISYLLSEKIKLSALYQVAQRPDIAKGLAYRAGLYFGAKYSL